MHRDQASSFVSIPIIGKVRPKRPGEFGVKKVTAAQERNDGGGNPVGNDAKAIPEARALIICEISRLTKSRETLC